MKKHPMKKAEAYLQKAKDILCHILLEDDEHYADAKSIKKAGRTAWKGCVEALDYVLYQEHRDCHEYVSEYDKAKYKEWLTGVDSNVVTVFESAYNLLNFTMACDGEKDKVICDRAMSYGEKLLDWCKSRQAIVEQQKEEERRRNEEEWRKQKEEEKQRHKEADRQKNELLDLMLAKANLKRNDIIETAYKHWMAKNLDLITPEEKKRFNLLVFS